jgi:hypothetical protein
MPRPEPPADSAPTVAPAGEPRSRRGKLSLGSREGLPRLLRLARRGQLVLAASGLRGAGGPHAHAPELEARVFGP